MTEDINAKVNMYKTANMKMYSGVHVFSFHSSWNEKKMAPYNVSERNMRHESVNTSRTNNIRGEEYETEIFKTIIREWDGPKDSEEILRESQSCT